MMSMMRYGCSMLLVCPCPQEAVQLHACPTNVEENLLVFCFVSFCLGPNVGLHISNILLSPLPTHLASSLTMSVHSCCFSSMDARRESTANHRFVFLSQFSFTWLRAWDLQWGPCALCYGIQNSMEAILACNPALSTERLDWVAFSCELWPMRTGSIDLLIRMNGTSLVLWFTTVWQLTPLGMQRQGFF